MVKVLSAPSFGEIRMYTIVNSGPLMKYITLDVNDGCPTTTRWPDRATLFPSRQDALSFLARARIEYPDEDFRLTQRVSLRSHRSGLHFSPLAPA